MKSRGVLRDAGRHRSCTSARRALESLTLDREVLHLRDSLVPRYAEMIYYGFWFSPERQALQTFMDECQRDVTGTVRLKLYKGNVTVAGPPLAALALPHRLRHVRGRHRLPPARRRGVHQPQRAAAEDPLAARPPEADVRLDVAATPDGAATRADACAGVDRARHRRAARLHHASSPRSANGCAGVVPVADAGGGATPRGRRRPARSSRGSAGASRSRASTSATRRWSSRAARVGGRDDRLHHQQRHARAAGRARRRAAVGVAAFVNLTAPRRRGRAAQGRDVRAAVRRRARRASRWRTTCARACWSSALLRRRAGGSAGGRGADAAARRRRGRYGKDVARLAQDSSWARHLAVVRAAAPTSPPASPWTRPRWCRCTGADVDKVIVGAR